MSLSKIIISKELAEVLTNLNIKKDPEKKVACRDFFKSFDTSATMIGMQKGFITKFLNRTSSEHKLLVDYLRQTYGISTVQSHGIRYYKGISFDAHPKSKSTVGLERLSSTEASLDDFTERVCRELSVLSGTTLKISIIRSCHEEVVVGEINETIKRFLSPELRTVMSDEGILMVLDDSSWRTILDYIRETVPQQDQIAFRIKIGTINAKPTLEPTLAGTDEFISVNLDLDIKKSFEPPFEKAVEVRVELDRPQDTPTERT